MKFILIIMLMSGSLDGGVAIKDIGPFSKMEYCQEAQKQLPKKMDENNFYDFGAIRSYCVEVK